MLFLPSAGEGMESWNVFRKSEIRHCFTRFPQRINIRHSYKVHSIHADVLRFKSKGSYKGSYMSAPKKLTRLLRLRKLEEEQQRVVLELAVAESNRLQQYRELAIEQLSRGKQEFIKAIEQDASASRETALVEVEHAAEQRDGIEARLITTNSAVIHQRAEYLERRTVRQQVEQLLEAASKAREIEAGRRAQQMLDDWYGQRIRALRTEARRKQSADPLRYVLDEPSGTPNK